MDISWIMIYLFDPFPLVILLGLVEFQPPFLTPFWIFLVSVMILMVFVGAELAAEANIACPAPCATPKGRPSSICCTHRGAVGEISGAVGPSHGIQRVETWRFRFDTNMKNRHKYILHVAPDVSVWLTHRFFGCSDHAPETRRYPVENSMVYCSWPKRRLAMVFTSSNGPLAKQWSGGGQGGKRLGGRVVEMGEDFNCPGKDGRR
jgi:hypothetical protein